ncbi:IS30 family transposase, partial [Frankia sp. Cj3]|uniref:IS30 family transposase n=1 Tax=Frankia sp. Cj3 TaxID=2880976 RepID=UPI001EF431B3
EADDRAVPGFWEGDLIIGKGNKSQIATLVDRTTRFVMLVRIPYDRNAERVAYLLAKKMETLPEFFRNSVTWDQGKEMARHADFTVRTGMPVYFCDPHSPWQRGSNENTNGLLRQYFPKGTDLSLHSQEDLDRVATEPNGRPRETLGWRKPIEVFNDLLERHASP